MKSSLQSPWLRTLVLCLVLGAAPVTALAAPRSVKSAGGGPHHALPTQPSPAATPTSFATSPIPHDEWFLMTLAGRTVGFSHDSYNPAVWNGKPGWKFEEVFQIYLSPTEFFSTRTTNYTRPDGSNLETDAIRDDPSGHVSTRALYYPTYIDAKATAVTRAEGHPAINVKPVRIKIPAGVTLAPQTPYEIAPTDIKPGKVIPQWSLDTDKLALQRQIATVETSETLPLPERGPVKAWKVRVRTVGESEDYFLWVTSSGEGVKVVLPIGGAQLVGVLTPYRKMQPQQPAVPVWRAAREASIPSPVMIQHPRLVNVMDLAINNAPSSLQIPSNGPQTVVSTGPSSWHVSIATPGQPERSPFEIFTSQGTPAAPDTETLVVEPAVTGVAPLPVAEKAAYLASTPLVNSGAPEIANRARTITAGATTPLDRAMRLRDWVFDRMQVDAHEPADRTAAAILNQPKGSGRDYVVLYTALARASGIPTRVCAGLIYDAGKFWSHSWAESWVGGWVPVDPSLGGHFMDATHVKLAEGDVPTVLTRGAEAVASLAGSGATLHVDWVQPPGAR